MQGARDLVDSERGVFAIAAVLLVTVLAMVGVVTGQQWLEYTKWIATALIFSKTVTTAVEHVAKRKTPSVDLPDATVVTEGVAP